MLRVRLFGGLRVESMTATDIGSRKARTLLAVLAAARGEPVPSDRLAAAVWGDTRPASPGDQLGVLVSRLRRTLGPNAIHRAGGGFRLEPHWLDLAEFRDRAAEAAERLSRGAAGAALVSATAALQLAAGPLLAGEDRYELGNQVPDSAWAKLLADAGFTRFRRATETPFNRVFEVRP